jgi:RimJ/RimL family protein N-acetyltransferase
MPQPILRTNRLLLVPLADRHLELEVELDADPEVMRLVGGSSTRDEVVADHARRLSRADRVDGLGYWMAFAIDLDIPGAGPPADEDAGEFVGWLMLPPAHGPDQPDDPTVCDLGYRIRRRLWRRGLASEASLELLRHAFDGVGQSRAIAQTRSVNAGSRAVMEKLGLRYVRTYASHHDDPLPGTDTSEVEYEMTREMWVAARGSSER